MIVFEPLTAGDGIEGHVTAVSSTTSEYTSDSIPVLTVSTDDGDAYEVRGFHSVLRHEIIRANPQVGDRFAVRYVGKLPTRDGRKTFHSYKVAVSRTS